VWKVRVLVGLLRVVMFGGRGRGSIIFFICSLKSFFGGGCFCFVG
jgi:hypothetical protein